MRVTGVFHAACPQHGGDVDLHADSLTVLVRGGPTPHPVSKLEVGGALAALVLTVGLIMWSRRMEQARRLPKES